jgi:hypothetical protein
MCSSARQVCEEGLSKSYLAAEMGSVAEEVDEVPLISFALKVATSPDQSYSLPLSPAEKHRLP